MTTVVISDVAGPELDGQPIVVNTSCGENNGSVIINTMGGTGALTYDWSHDGNLVGSEAADLSPGDYSVSITDENSCEVAAEFRISESESPAITVTQQTDASCGRADGMVTIATQFLNGPLTFTWAHDLNLNGPVATNLLAGSYPLTYTWSHNSTITGPTASNLAAGSYFVTVTGDNDCSAETTFSIENLTGPVLAVNPQITDTSCGEDNGSATVTATGGTGLLTYQWSHDNAIAGPTAIDLAAGDYQVSITDVNNCILIVDLTVEQSRTPLIVVSSITDASCGVENGSATVNTQFLNGTLTYNWSHDATLSVPTANNLATGSYSVTVSGEGGCSARTTFLIESLDGPELLMSADVTNTTCGDDNGSATVFVTGGTGGLSYCWSHDLAIVGASAISLPAGDYEVTISDANGCEVIAFFTVEASEVPIITIAEQVDETCEQDNGSATVSTEFLVGSLTYSWTHDPSLTGPTAIALSAGAYPVSVTGENGCTVQMTVLIESLDGPELNGQPSVIATICGEDNGLATVNASGGTGTLTYAWNHDPAIVGPTAEGLSAGDYRVTITDDNGCEVVSALRVPDSQLPTISVAQLNDARCGEANGSVTVNTAFLSPPFLTIGRTPKALIYPPQRA